MKKIKVPQPQKILWLKTLRWRLTLFVFAILMGAALFTMLVYLILQLALRQYPVVDAILVNPYLLIVTLLLVCAMIGTGLSIFFGRYYLRPLKELIHATNQVKNGNFKVQIKRKTKREISEMGQLIDSFNDMTRELDGIELFRNDFINNFSHEFKTPIVSIRGFARELEKGDLDENTRREYAAIIAHESDRLARLSTSVLELSKLENQKIITDKTRFYLDEQLRRCILSQEQSWSDRQIDVIPELEETLFYANEEILWHIWSNLLSNALKFTPEGGIVRISLQKREGHVEVRFSDTGVGMTEEVKEHIFEKFYQGDPSHSTKGYGVGLTMAARAVNLCNGRIDVESELGKGSIFTVLLPREQAEKESNA